MTVSDALTAAAARIDLRDAQTLLARVLEHERTWLFAHPEAEVEELRAETFFADVGRRARGEPLQYVLGVQEFFGLPLRVSPAVLVPRPETEHLVEAVLQWASTQEAHLRVMDVGTGSGAIALALATHLPQAEVFATDISEAALAVALDNAARLGLEKRVRFAHGDLLAPFSGLIKAGLRFDVVASNPPYVSIRDKFAMQREVVEHEPHTALFAGPDGFAVYRRLVPQAHSALRGSGLLAMEFGFGQKDQIAELLHRWHNVRFHDDYSGVPRVVMAECA